MDSEVRYFRLGEDGNPRLVRGTHEDWTRNMQEEIASGRHRIARTEIDGHVVSTIFLAGATQHPFMRQPMLFETVAFGPDLRRLDVDWCEQQAGTRKAADLNHRYAVKMLKRHVAAPAPAPGM